MKKLLAAVITALMLVGCSSGTSEKEATQKEEIKAYVFETNGTTVAMNQDLSEIKDKLGKEQEKFTSPSCAFEGQEDNVYTYASYQLITYTKDNKEYIYQVTLKDDTVTTQEGIALGETKENVMNKYGKDYTEKNGALTYSAGDCQLEFLFENDTLTQITYTAVVE